VTCPTCGTAMSQSDAACPACGQIQPPMPKSKTGPVQILAIILLILVGIPSCLIGGLYMLLAGACLAGGQSSRFGSLCEALVEGAGGVLLFFLLLAWVIQGERRNR